MRRKITLIGLFAMLCLQQAFAQNKSSFWSAVNNSPLLQNKTAGGQSIYIPPAYKTFHLAEAAFRQQLATVPSEKNVAAGNSSFIISVPNAKGELERFKVVEAPVVSAALALKYPQLKSYAGQGIDEPSATIRFDITPQGFHGMILSDTRKTIYINPVDKNNGLYIVFDRDDMGERKNKLNCDLQGIGAAAQSDGTVPKNADDNKLRIYRFAVTVGGQFSKLCLDGTETTDSEKKLSVLSTLVTDLTRINGIYERDFDVRLNYVDNEDTIIFLNYKTDPFTDNAVTGYGLGQWNTQCQKTLDKYIGNSNYDCGHLLMGIPTGGNAGCIGCVTVSARKGSAVTGYDEALGDPFVVDFWAHEIGHQFGGAHTFDYSNEGSGAQMEPGSGSTIMGYAGTTGATDVQPHSDDYFHAISIQQITDYVKSIDGAAGPIIQPTGNHTPSANAGADYTIPSSTPFALTGRAADADAGDALSYNWEQFDGISAGYNKYPDSTVTAGPVFRSFNYAPFKSRTFPELDTILAGKTSWKWEALPSVSRVLNFRFTARDNHAGGGSNNSDDMKVTTDSTSGPFVVTGLDRPVTWTVGSSVTVKWNVANTTNAKVNCSKVTIQLSTDGGHTFPVTLIANTPNDGSQVIQVPNKPTTRGRIRVQAVGNVFFDISNANLTIAAALALPVDLLSFTAGKSAKGVNLKWSMATEINSNRFEIERSINGVDYLTIGTTAAGKSQYNFADLQAASGSNYYRIKKIDNNGTYQYSAVAAVSVDAAGAAVVVYPNPATHVAHVKLNQSAANISITLTNAGGKVVYAKSAGAMAAGADIQLPVSSLAHGVYTVNIKTDRGNFTQQLLVE